MITDKEALQEALMASSGAHMMNQNPMGGMGTDFNKVFAAEK